MTRLRQDGGRAPGPDPIGRRGIARVGAVIVAMVLWATNPAAGAVVLEAEDGTLVGTSVSTAVSGYSGRGYVTGFDAAGDLVRWAFPGSNGLHRLTLRFRTPYGAKGYEGKLNGAGFSGMFPQTNGFTLLDAGLVELQAGTNTLEIGGGWNWYEIDRVDLTAAPPPPPPQRVAATPVDPEATVAVRALLQALADDYGRRTWSGQQGTDEITNVFNASGRKPVIVSGDLIDYSPSRVAFQGAPAGYTESMIALESVGHVVAMCWHWNAPSGLLNTASEPWWRGFYTSATTFDLAAALAQTHSVQYGELLRDMDAIAVQLRKFAQAQVPVLWRPLHESEGGWFWWGAKGPGPFKQLWRLLYDRLTRHHALHNLVWVLTSEDPAWYPGDDVVDVLGVDGYPAHRSDVLFPNWEGLKARFDGRKLIALTEFGGVPDIERMQRFGVWWAWFAPWTGTYGPGSMPTSTVARIYQSVGVVTLDELNAVAPRLTGVERLPSGGTRLSGTGRRGAGFHLVASPEIDLPAAGWGVTATGVFSGGVFTVEDRSGTNAPRRFYRVVQP